MKFSKLFLFTLLATATLFISCGDDETTVTDVVSDSEVHTSLLAALEKTGLDATLDGEGSFTLFAPTNTAFTTFLAENGFANLDAVPTATLESILLNHVVSGKNLSTSLSTGYVSTLATGPGANNLSAYISTANGVQINGVSTVTGADLDASNGVVHVVDEVIGLPTVVTFATADPTFSTLVAALTRETSFPFVGVLSGTDNSPFTVFAPNNMAFTNLLGALGLDELGDVPTDLLADVLSYHVVAGANVRSSDLTDGQVVSTFLTGESVTVDLDGGAKLIDARGRAANIDLVDVQAANGVIHVIDQVILPTE